MWRKRKAVGSNGRRRLRRRRRRLTGRSPGECDGLPQKALSSLHLPIKPPFRLESLRRARQRETEGDRERGRGMDFPSPTLKPARRSRKTRSSTWDEQYGRPRRPFIRATSGTVEPNRIVSYSTGSPGRDEPPASERSPRGRPTHCRRRAPSPPPPRVDVQTDWTNFNNFAGCLRQPPSIGRRRSPPVGRRPGRSTAGLDFRFELFRLPAFWGAVRPQRRRRGLSAEPRLSGSSSISWISGAAAAVSRHRALPRRALCVWPESQRRGRQKLRRFWQRRREFRRIDTRCEEVTRG